MPPARSATAAPRRQPRPAPRKAPRLINRPPKLRVRWERVGRVGLLVVLGIVMALYVEHTLSYFATRTQANQQQAVVSRLSRQNAQLSRQVKSLSDPSTIVSDARSLGMVRPNERPYVITGTPSP
jgi:cell division protein FtsB